MELLSNNYEIEVVSNSQSVILHYGPGNISNAINVPSHLINRILMVKDKGVYPNNKYFDRLLSDELKKIEYFGKSKSKIDYDAIAIIFALVSRVQERGTKDLDKYNRFQAQNDLVSKNNLLSMVPADYAMDHIAQLIFNGNNVKKKTHYNIIPTHDVDRLKSYHRPLLTLRYFIGDLVKRKKPISAFYRLLDYFPGEPQGSFNFLMSLSESYGLRSRFFFMGPTSHIHDSPYFNLYPKVLKKLLNNIKSRGHIIGFHPGYSTYNNEYQWNIQKKGLEKLVGDSITEGRQHMLQYNIETTPHIWDKNRMIVEYTLGYPDKIGFRNGTCRPVKNYDLKTRRTINLQSISTPIMDFGLFGGKYNNYSFDQAMDKCLPIIKVCRKFNGYLVILMHSGRQPGYIKKFYSELLKSASLKDLTF